jgi:hypothetical protein
MRAFLSVVGAGICGALVTAAVGALIGLAIRAAGLGVDYSWLDWPIGGAIFGALVGGTGGILGGALTVITQAGAQQTDQRHILGPVVEVFFGAACGIIVAILSRGMLGAAIFLGFMGTVGGAIGGQVGGRVAAAILTHGMRKGS